MQFYNEHWFPDNIKPTAAPHAMARRDKAFAAMAPYLPAPGGVCVQAGGMTGLWPLQFLRAGFAKVVTFEPAPHVWECLVANCAHEIDSGTIEAHNSALGDARCTTGIVCNSLGSSYIDARAPVSCAMTTLDSLQLPRVDYVQFDLEGLEFPALVGAKKTILRDRPPIQLELKGLDSRYLWSEKDVRTWLSNMGYVERAPIPGGDVIFTHVSKS